MKREWGQPIIYVSIYVYLFYLFVNNIKKPPAKSFVSGWILCCPTRASRFQRDKLLALIGLKQKIPLIAGFFCCPTRASRFQRDKLLALIGLKQKIPLIAGFFCCPTRARTWTLLIQNQTCCQLHHQTIFIWGAQNYSFFGSGDNFTERILEKIRSPESGDRRS